MHRHCHVWRWLAEVSDVVPTQPARIIMYARVQYWPDIGLDNGQILVDCIGPFMDSQIGAQHRSNIGRKLGSRFLP